MGGIFRSLARTLRDVTSVKAEDLRSPPVAEVTPLERPAIAREPAKSQVICIASGKGGTGKTVITTNIAVSLANKGLKVLLFDADLGLANAHLLLGISPPNDISSVLDGSMRLSDIVVECASGLRLIPGGSGYSEFAELKDRDLRNFAQQFKECEGASDIVLVDLAAGIGPQVMRFLRASHEIILVTTPDVTAMLDAYATLKSLAQSNPAARVNLIVNRVRDRYEAIGAFKKIRTVAARHLPNAEVKFFGWLPHNWYVQDSVSRREPVVLLHPKSFVTSCVESIAARIKASHLDWMERRDAPVAITTEAPSQFDSSFSSRLLQMVYE